ncbi:universal stress protein [Actinoplanes sp. NPDC049681]|uniref:universal stress protein n=1 Tax=Actinoplanes sp. NPDC049681 TaxID=3363905 RepID=UPI0037B390FA
MIKPRIVVGADGSAGATAAVRWAAAEAALREADLRVVTAFHRHHPVLHDTTDPQARQAPDDDTAAVLHAAVVVARSAAPGVEVRGLALPGYAAPVLLHAAEVAALLVVGSRGNRRMPGMPTGSVGNQVATQSLGSVVVVRGRSGADTGPVLVGVDDSPASGPVIGRAFEEASLHRAPLLAITVRTGPGESTAAEDQLATWQEKYPEVTAEAEVVTGRPDKVLAERSAQARLVVVGPRRHGFEGVLLGEVGTRLLHQADCPVLIARS